MATFTVVRFIERKIKRTEHPSPLFGFSEHAIYDGEGRRFPTLVHFFWAHKYLQNLAWVARISGAETPYAATLMALETVNDDADEWVQRRIAVLHDGLRRKAFLHRDVFDTLVGTIGTISALDNFPFGTQTLGEGNHPGTESVYGHVLMYVREECLNGVIPRPSLECGENISALRARGFAV